MTSQILWNLRSMFSLRDRNEISDNPLVTAHQKHSSIDCNIFDKKSFLGTGWMCYFSSKNVKSAEKFVYNAKLNVQCLIGFILLYFSTKDTFRGPYWSLKTCTTKFVSSRTFIQVLIWLYFAWWFSKPKNVVPSF